MTNTELTEKISQLKKDRNAIILAHVYQQSDIQDIADFTGDSLGLSRQAVETDADVIVFCGVRFMAETASILNPKRTVLLPELRAGCPMADMADVHQIREMKKKHPDALVVSYVNSTADVKAESDICCTSANAVAVVASLPEKPIIFLPDKNLGTYTASETGRKIIPWKGFCYVHERLITTETVQNLKTKHPEALVLVHPECNQAVAGLGDFIGSTTQMMTYVADSPAQEFIIATEQGMIHALKKKNPDKTFYATNGICSDMRLITLGSVLKSLQHLQHRIQVPEPVRTRAEQALQKMLSL